MRLLLVGLALCGAIPAHALEHSAELSLFDYSAGHSYTGMPFAFVAMAPASEQRNEPPQEQTSASLAPPATEQPDKLSKVDLCSMAASAAAANKLPVRFFANLIHQESGFK